MRGFWVMGRIQCCNFRATKSNLLLGRYDVYRADILDFSSHFMYATAGKQTRLKRFDFMAKVQDK